MIELALGFAVGVFLTGFVAYKWPGVFGHAVTTGASVVNAADDKINATVKSTLNK